jgi:hypothetical protein
MSVSDEPEKSYIVVQMGVKIGIIFKNSLRAVYFLSVMKVWRRFVYENSYLCQLLG